jgi:hypothetical protein
VVARLHRFSTPVLAGIGCGHHIGRMEENNRTSWRDSNAYRMSMLSLGWLLVLGAPLLGPIPGPGPLIILPIGLALILKNSLWAKKRYARLARTYPSYGRWTDWAMRRSKVTERPPFPDLKADFMHLFRRDDIDQDMR